MAAPTLLRSLDDRLLHRRAPDSGAHAGDGARAALALTVRVVQLVLLALAAVLVAAIVLVVLPANESNAVVRWVLSTANTVAGPLRDVFDMHNRPLRALTNYGLAAAVYVVIAKLVGRLAPARR